MFFNKSSLKAICFCIISSISINLYPFGPKTSPASTMPEKNEKTSFAEKIKSGIDGIGKFLSGPTLKELPEILETTSIFGYSLVSDNEWRELEIDAILKKWSYYTHKSIDQWGLKTLIKHAPEGCKELIKALVKNKEVFKKAEELMQKVETSGPALKEFFQPWDIARDDIATANATETAKSGLLGNIPQMLSAKLNFISKIETSCPFSVSKLINTSSIALANIIGPIFTLFMTIGGNQTLQDFSLFRAGVTKSFNFKKNLLSNVKNFFNRLSLIPKMYKFGQFDKELFEKSYNSNEIIKKETIGDRFCKMNIKSNIFLGNIKSDNNNKTILTGTNIPKSIAASVFAAALTVYNSFGRIILPMGLVAYSIYGVFSKFKECKEIHKKLTNISSIIKTIDSFNEIFQDQQSTPEIIKNLQEELRPEKYFLVKRVEDLIKSLKSSTFEPNANILSSVGKIFATRDLLKQESYKFLNALKNIALLGGCLAIAKMFKENDKYQAKLCFITETKGATPVIDLKDSWFPLIKRDQVVTNNIDLGGENNAKHAIITGPNGGGKSVIMMTAAFNVLLSKLGVATASSATISNFSKIVTSMHPIQNVENGDSCFMSECRRMYSIFEEINLNENKYEDFPSNKHILALIDEPYKGTSDAATQDLIYKKGIKLAKTKKCCALIATHTKKPSELASAPETNGSFKNYQIECRKVETEEKTSAFERTFKLQPDAAKWWLDNTENRRSMYIKWLIKQALSQKS